MFLSIKYRTKHSLVTEDDQAAFTTQFYNCMQNPTELAIYVRLRSYLPDAVPGSKEQWPVYEIKGHPHFSGPPSTLSACGSNLMLDCRCFFIMARPYPTRGTAMSVSSRTGCICRVGALTLRSNRLDSFLELKLENERLRQRLTVGPTFMPTPHFDSDLRSSPL